MPIGGRPYDIMLCIAEVNDYLAQFVMFIPLLTHDMVITPTVLIII